LPARIEQRLIRACDFSRISRKRYPGTFCAAVLPRKKGGVAVKKTAAAALCATGFVLANPPLGFAQDVLTTHRLSAALAAEAVGEAVAACAKQGYKVTAAILDIDGVTQSLLRGDGASMTTLGAARDKAYTVLMLGAPRNEDSSGAIAQRIGATPSAGGLAKLPHILLLQGAIRIKVGGEAVEAIGVGGAPGGDLDEACAKAGLDKISGRLK
jgi:uncharacterized protein GlcG (DUF336 family)